MRLPIEVANSTRQGHRNSNQDRAAAHLPWAFILDGVGGSRNGGAAAQVALGALLQESAMLPPDFADMATRREAMRHLIESAHVAVSRLLGQPEGGSSGSTTLTLAHLRMQETAFVDVVIASVGDSPVWVTAGGTAPVLVSSTQQGLRRNTLDGAIGWRMHEPQFYSVTIPVPGRLVLATDGLLDLETDHRNRLMSDVSSTAQECASHLTAAAIRAGGRDNTTALILDVGVSDAYASDHLGV